MDIYKITKYSHSSEKDIEWFNYSYFYFNASKHLAEQLKSLISKGLSYESQGNTLLVPIIYNLRHGIELLLKYLSFGTSLNLNLTHDISKLFETVKKALSSIDETALHQAADSLRIKKETMNELPEAIIHNMEELIHKYHGYVFLTDGTAEIEDKMNVLFRYPSILENGYKVDLDELSNKISLDEILQDIEDLLGFLFMFTFLFGKTPDGSSLLSKLEGK